MSLKDILKKSGLVEDDPTDVGEEPAPATSAARPVPTQPSRFFNYVAASVPAVSVAASAPKNVPATVTTEFISALNEAMDKATNKGYVEFQKLFTTLGSVPESQRYATAISILQTSLNIDAASLLASFDERAQLLDAERNDFNAFCESETQGKVVAAQNQISEVEKDIEQKRQEIASLEEQRAKLTTDANNASAEIQMRQVAFSVSYESTKNQLAAERSHILPFVTVK
jgi:hypothetical protein